METTVYGEEISLATARQLSLESGQHSEPYRGYGHELKDGRFLLCAKPDGKFYIRSKIQTDSSGNVI